eukprot:CAMPEP_0206524746 /NCGR_PEP_ID=MMETSP0324_2-20121206/68349_1 /ASSEMBLY_ACC=CAM_ASM_000836 /TAXON_ID=2866 /ORGANISM="Crypthecodinium cohnii, Strain Seligo" /LENGTH=35 /DNA_ID= /DNA_START= /DNA_END= /DNA_ORIENTATION=
MKNIIPTLLKWKCAGRTAKKTLKPIQKKEVQNQIQ